MSFGLKKRMDTSRKKIIIVVNLFFYNYIIPSGFEDEMNVLDLFHISEVNEKPEGLVLF